MKPCPLCGVWVESLPNGKTYNNNGSWHSSTCRPSPAYQKKAKARRADWEAKNLIGAEEKEDNRGYVPLWRKAK